MADLDSTLRANREAVNDLIASSERCGPVWTTPRAAGKWSPSQIVEHVSRSLEEGANLISGKPSKLITLPFFLRPVARMFLFNRVLRTGTFPRAKTNKAMDPAVGPATVAEARRRLDDALARFDRECHACAQRGGTFVSGAFGRVSVNDYARFVDTHTRHHCRQMPIHGTSAGG